MTKDLFIITGGGTGAKVAESLIHLAAAGVAPDRIHMLLVDSDTSNGNLNRTIKTAEAYEKVAEWPWTVEASISRGLFRGRNEVSNSLFKTEIHCHQLTKQIDTVFKGGLKTSAPASMGGVMDLLFDESEQGATCDDGFRARPNLGCLLLADHLNSTLMRAAPGFFEALQRAVSSAGDKQVPIVVCASVFGGTGASLLPIARRCVEHELTKHVEKSTLNSIRWAAVKLLPHYQPANRKESVDPHRFLLDAASALQFYSSVYRTEDSEGRYDAVYVIGSDNPNRNTVQTVLGHRAQANPAYFEELLAALAVLRFSQDRTEPSRPIHVYCSERVRWESLPGVKSVEAQYQLAFLLHMGAFLLKRGDHQADHQLSYGLLRLLKTSELNDIRSFPWYKDLLDNWAMNFPQYQSAKKERKPEILMSASYMQRNSIEHLLSPVAEYFGRLLLWGSTSVAHPETGLVALKEGSYAEVYDAMAAIKEQEIAAGVPDSRTDNALIRLLRGCLSAMIHIHDQVNRGRQLNRGFKLMQNGDHIELFSTMAEIEESLSSMELGAVVDEYRRTQIAA